MPHSRFLLSFLLALSLAACETERTDDRGLLERIAETGATLAGGSYDIPPEDSASQRIFTTAHRDTLAPNPHEVNPPDVEVEGTPPSPRAAEPDAPGLVIPVAGIQPDDLFDTYTDARGHNRIHNAIDIMAPRGAPVLAAASGTVVRLFESERGGLTLYQLDPDGETVYYYAHLDGYQPGLEAGQRVQRGDTLGSVGDSGNAAPGNTHLHFAMWVAADSTQFWDGEPINPYPLLVNRPSATGGSAAQP